MRNNIILKLKGMGQSVCLDRKFLKIVMIEVLGKGNVRGASLDTLNERNSDQMEFIKTLFTIRVNNDNARMIQFNWLVCIAKMRQLDILH